MIANLHEFLDKLNLHPPASESQILEEEEKIRLKFPTEYVEFLKLCNGGEGLVGKSYVIFWRVDELASLNSAYQVEEYAPGLLIFGSDGGGEAYGLDTRDRDWPIVKVPFVGMEWGIALPMGASFNEFLQRLYEAK